jgi:hypothetical protein
LFALLLFLLLLERNKKKKKNRNAITCSVKVAADWRTRQVFRSAGE